MAAGVRADDSTGGKDALPSLLVRLREGDVVRLCGLSAAALGLDAVARHAVIHPHRVGARLSATISATLTPQDESPGAETLCETWAELIESPDAGKQPKQSTTPLGRSPRQTLTLLQWDCSCQPDHPAHPAHPAQRLGCAHVAALLTSWIRSPGDFRTPVADPAPTRSTQPTPASSPLVARPAAPSERRFSLADELARLSATDAQELAQRLASALRDAPTTPLATDSATAELFDESEAARAYAFAALCEPAHVQRLVARLDADARTTLNDLLLRGGSITTGDLAALMARAGRPASAAQRVMAPLERFGLVFRAFQLSAAPTSSTPSTSSTTSTTSASATQRLQQIAGWRIAPELRAALPATLPTSAPTSQHPLQPPGRQTRGTPLPLCLALALLARAPAPFGPYAPQPAAYAGRPSASRRLAPQAPQRGVPLTPGDLPATQMIGLARHGGLNPGLAQMARRVLLWAREHAPGQPLTDLASVAPAERALAMRVGFHLWRSALSAAELLDLEHFTSGERDSQTAVKMRYDLRHPAFRPAALASEAAEAREFVVGLLTHATPGVWYQTDALLDLIWRIHPLFLRGRQLAYDTPVWRLERVADGRPLRPSVHAEWLAGEGAYIRMLLAGPLHWWGALDLASDGSSKRHFSAFRLTPFGAFLLAGRASDGAVDLPAQARQALLGQWEPALLATREGMLAVQPLMASATLLKGLICWAQPVRIAGGRLLYTLTPDRACVAFDQGLEPADAVTMLDATGRAAGAILARLLPWRERYAEARLEYGWALLEARDEPTLREALTYAPEIAARARALTPTQALIASADLDALRAILARKGFTL